MGNTKLTHDRRVGATYRADIQGKDEDDEEAEIPGQEGPEQHQWVLLAEVSIAMQEKKWQEEDQHNLDTQGSTAHPVAAIPTYCAITFTHCLSVCLCEPCTDWEAGT